MTNYVSVESHTAILTSDVLPQTCASMYVCMCMHACINTTVCNPANKQNCVLHCFKYKKVSLYILGTAASCGNKDLRLDSSLNLTRMTFDS